MQVIIELNDDQVESVLAEGLKRAYETHLTFPNEPDYEELHEAFKIMLKYFLGEKAGSKYLHGLAKIEKKYNARRLVEAEGGL
jgi:hypothetical protein